MINQGETVTDKILTRDAILARKNGGGSKVHAFKLPDGSTVKIRGLSRDQAMGTADRVGVPAQDNYVISTGLVEPAMSEEDVAAWATIPGEAGNLHALSREISRISGMHADAGKEAYKSTGGESGS